MGPRIALSSIFMIRLSMLNDPLLERRANYGMLIVQGCDILQDRLACRDYKDIELSLALFAPKLRGLYMGYGDFFLQWIYSIPITGLCSNRADLKKALCCHAKDTKEKDMPVYCLRSLSANMRYCIWLDIKIQA